MSENAQVRGLYKDYRRLDDEVGDALRAALGRTRRARPRSAWWVRVGRSLTVAAAACLAALVWFQPTPAPRTDPGQARPQRAGVGPSWFAPATPRADEIEPLPSAYERPELRVRGTQRDWIVIPGREPGTYLVIEIDRVRTHVIGVHQDF